MILDAPRNLGQNNLFHSHKYDPPPTTWGMGSVGGPHFPGQTIGLTWASWYIRGRIYSRVNGYWVLWGEGWGIVDLSIFPCIPYESFQKEEGCAGEQTPCAKEQFWTICIESQSIFLGSHIFTPTLTTSCFKVSATNTAYHIRSYGHWCFWSSCHDEAQFKNKHCSTHENSLYSGFRPGLIHPGMELTLAMT